MCLYAKAPDAVDMLNTEMIVYCKEKMASGNRELFNDCMAAVKTFLAGEPFSQFQESMYFHRYLQWKWLERFVVTTWFMLCTSTVPTTSKNTNTSTFSITHLSKSLTPHKFNPFFSTFKIVKNKIQPPFSYKIKSL